MSTVEINELVTQSLIEPRRVFVDHVTDKPAYIERVLHQFVAGRIFPQLETVRIRDFIAPFVNYAEGAYQFYFVCKSELMNVFYDPKSGLFGAAFGPEIENNEYLDLGQRDSDVLAMLAA